MTTASEMVTDAFERINYKSAETPLEAADLTRGLKVLDRMLSRWEDSKIRLGYTSFSDGAEVLSVPKNAEEGIEASLAIRLASEYRVTLDPILFEQLKEAVNDLMIANGPKITTEYPGNLPFGSGNIDRFDREDRFYTNSGDPNF